jgi:hypothetical protein
VGCCEHGSAGSGSIKGMEFLDFIFLGLMECVGYLNGKSQTNVITIMLVIMSL